MDNFNKSGGCWASSASQPHLLTGFPQGCRYRSSRVCEFAVSRRWMDGRTKGLSLLRSPLKVTRVLNENFSFSAEEVDRCGTRILWRSKLAERLDPYAWAHYLVVLAQRLSGSTLFWKYLLSETSTQLSLNIYSHSGVKFSCPLNFILQHIAVRNQATVCY